MKPNFARFIPAVLTAATLLGAAVMIAETPRIEATSTKVNARGTITEFGPQSITVKTEKGDTPVRYISNDTTNFVDENGDPIPHSTVKSGLPVTVFYTKVGDTLVASRVMVQTNAPASSRRAARSRS